MDNAVETEDQKLCRVIVGVRSLLLELDEQMSTLAIELVARQIMELRKREYAELMAKQNGQVVGLRPLGSF